MPARLVDIKKLFTLRQATMCIKYEISKIHQNSDQIPAQHRGEESFTQVETIFELLIEFLSLRQREGSQSSSSWELLNERR